MERLITASVQQRMRVFATLDDYESELQRFLRIAQHKQASLVIFPELGGSMLLPPMLRDLRTSLLKHAELGRRRRASLWQRYSGRSAEWLAALFATNFSSLIVACLEAEGEYLWQTYCDLFGKLAQQTNLTLVAPSAYLPDPADGVIRNITGVFGSEGTLLGHQAKVMLHDQDKAVAQAGTDWEVIHTDVGAIGILLGSDVLYPEIARLLAYKGAEILVGQGACPTTVLYQKLRAGILARMQDNQLFAAASYLVGRNDLSGRAKITYAGRSAIFAPQELTPRFNGVLVEMGSPSSEGVLSAEWNYVALRKLWEFSDTPLRKELPLKQVGRAIANLYARLEQAPDLLAENNNDNLSDPTQLAANHGLRTMGKPLLRLDELPVTGTITRRWPPNKLDYSAVDLRTAEMPDLTDSSATNSVFPGKASSTIATSVASSSTGDDDETEEMDALSEPQSEEKKDEKDEKE